MSRTERREAIDVPATTLYREVTDLECDGCGGEISTDPTVFPEQQANEIRVFLNPDDCVNFLRRRDYCPACLDPIWDAINKLIKADPEQEGTDPPQEEWEIHR